HLCQNPAFWMVFTQLRAVSTSGVARPFDRRADGLLLGEGAGIVALKRLEDAFRDGNRVYAVIKGSGSSSDGRVSGLLAPASSGQIEALRRAYADAGVDPATVSYVEAHGTATAAGDTAEIETLNAVFGESRFPTRVLGSVKSMIGHAMPAAGMASLIRTALALSNQILPPTLNCEEPRSELQGSSFHLIGDARPWIQSKQRGPRRAGVNAFGFGGINAHIVLEQAPATNSVTHAPCARPFWDVRRRPSEPLLFAAPTPEQLVERLRACTVRLENRPPDWRLEDVAFTLLNELDAEGNCKLALVCRDFAEAEQLLHKVADRLDRGECLEGDSRVYFRANCSAPAGKLAVVFPGMAFPGLSGEFPAHVLEMCMHFPALRHVADLLEDKDGDPDDPVPFSYILAPPQSLPAAEREALQARLAPPRPAPAERNFAAMGAIVSNYLSSRLLAELEIRPDMVCGLSMGDLSALCEAGALDFEADVLPRLWDQLGILPSELAQGKLAYVTAGAEQVERYLKGAKDCAVAIDLAPGAVIVGGPAAEIDRLVTELRGVGIVATGVPFTAAHTSHLSPVRHRIEAAIGQQLAQFKPPRIPVYSAIAAAPFPRDPAEIAALVTANLDRPVRAWQANRRLYEDGARVIVWAGCGSPIGQWDRIEGEAGVVFSAIDLEQAPPITQLNRLVGAIYTAGIRFRPSAIYGYRRPRLLEMQRGGEAAKPDHRTPVNFRWPFSVPEPLPPANSVPRGSEETRSAPPPPKAASVPPASSKATDASEPKQPRAAATSRLPFVGETLEYLPGQRLALRRVLDLDEDLYLQDHCFINAACSKPVQDCMPVFPLVMMMETMAEAATQLAPGLGLIGFKDVRADRWISLLHRRQSELRVEAVVVAVEAESGTCEVEASILHQGDPSASARVLLGRAYRHDVDLRFAPLESPGPWPITADQFYADKYTFHGPRFRTVSQMQSLGNNGLTGSLRVLSKTDLFAPLAVPLLLTDPAVIDGAGQLLGGWAQAFGAYVLPTAIERIEFYCPSPPPQTEVPIRVEITRYVPDREIVANIEIQNGQGAPWMRFIGWRDHVISDKPQVMEVHRTPRTKALSQIEPLPGGPDDALLAAVADSEFGAGAFQWISYLYLTAEELAASRNMVGTRPSQFILGRIAAKDAVRAWLARQAEGEMLHPATIVIDTEPNGRPVVRPMPGVATLPQISISHTGGRAIAAASSQPVGIDLESASSPSADLLAEFASGDEIAVLGGIGDESGDWAGPARLWCAKEAVGKALGTGLGGRPQDFQVIRADRDGRFEINHLPTGRQWTVSTIRDRAGVLAHCHAASVKISSPRTPAFTSRM
ncbi:MAG: polyketide synthase dehydratase domain-containing protein, partial [Planctomycetes bacterium]|nr:polyketide synthase dehydratase domain-containing protein [Planctomycetota bacterium]